VVLAKRLRPGRGWGSLENRREPPLDAAPSTLNPDRFGLKDLLKISSKWLSKWLCQREGKSPATPGDWCAAKPQRSPTSSYAFSCLSDARG
jgi:hypothetical protein